MFCQKCGSQVEDGQVVCPNCGTPVEGAAEVADAVEKEANDLGDKAKDVANNVAGAAGDVANKAYDKVSGVSDAVADKLNLDENTKSVLPKIICGVIAVIVVILLISLFSGGAKSELKKFYKSVDKFNAKTQFYMTVPKDCREDIVDDYYDTDVKEFLSVTQDAYDALEDGLKDVGKIDYSYEIKEIEKLGKLDKIDEDDLGGIEDLDDLKDYLEDSEMADEYDFNPDKVKKGYAAEVKWTLEVDGDKAAKGTDTVIIFKYKGDWYVLFATDTDTIAENLYWDGEEDYEDAVEDYIDAYEDLE